MNRLKRPSFRNLAAIIVMGVCGSGKSTVAAHLGKHLRLTVLEGDDYHPPGNIRKMTTGEPLDDADRWPWLDRLAEEIRNRPKAGRPMICTCSALKRNYRDRLRHSVGGPLVFLYLYADRRVIEGRLARRSGHFMSPALLASQLETLEEPTPDEHCLAIESVGKIEQLIERILLHLEQSRLASGAQESM